MRGPDPRSEDDTEELPSGAEAYTQGRDLRASTPYIVGRATALLTLFYASDAEWWVNEVEGLQLERVEVPAWTQEEFAYALRQLEVGIDVSGGSGTPVSLREWAAALPDDVSPVADARFPWVPERQATAAESLRSREPGGALALVASCLVDDHPLVRVAAAVAVLDHDRMSRVGVPNPLRWVNPVAGAIIDDARRARSDEVAMFASAARTGRTPTRGRVLWAEGDRSAPREAGVVSDPPDAALIHGTWARNQRWWRTDGSFHTYLRDEGIFPKLFSGPKPFQWSGYYGFRTRFPWPKSVDWNRLQAGGRLARWTDNNLVRPPHLIGHSCGASVAMMATREKKKLRGLVMLSPSVHESCLPDPAYYCGGLSIRARGDLVLRADGSQNNRLDALDRVEVWRMRRKGLTGHKTSHDPDAWRHDGLGDYVRDTWLAGLPDEPPGSSGP